MRQGLGVIALVLATTATAQTHSTSTPLPPATELTGSVAGHVFCADTNQPARFAEVSLQPIATTAPKSIPSPSAGASTVETTLDGSFTLSKVKPGDYYVVVKKEGYVNPRNIFTQKEIDDPTPALRSIVEQALPHVRVEANQTEHTEVRLERGAAISGTILYDDGSPASEISVKLLHKDATGKWVPLSGNVSGLQLVTHIQTDTDDRGFYRLASLLADEYMVEADLSLKDSKLSETKMPGGEIMEFDMMNFRFSLPFYGSGTARLGDASGLKIRAGQEFSGADMTIPLSKLHKLSGRVIAGRDGHVVNAAKLSLVTRDDDKELTSSDISREDGLFHFEFVPDGDYVLKVSNARDATWEPSNSPTTQDKESIVQAYGNTELPILLRGDMLDAIATVPPDAKPDAKPATSPTQ
jgi:hypothetical protein